MPPKIIEVVLQSDGVHCSMDDRSTWVVDREGNWKKLTSTLEELQASFEEAWNKLN